MVGVALFLHQPATAQDFTELLEIRRVKETLDLSQVPEPDLTGIPAVDAERLREYRALMQQVDLLVTPTEPVAAPRVDATAVEWEDGPEEIIPALGRLARPFNLLGVPACSLPCGFTREGLPIGLQLAGRAWDEATVLRAAYTYSRFLDDVSEFAESNQRLDRSILPLDETNLALDRGLSDFHIPHAFNFTYLYELPWMRQDRWLGGWSLSGVTTLQSGRPYSLFSGTNNPTGSDNNRIHEPAGSLIRDASSNIPVRLAEGFTKAHVTPAEGTLGTLGRNTERSDTLLSWNVSVSKNFSIDETKKVQIRGEFFNLFNTTNFDVVDNILTSPNFGRALEAFDPRRVQLALRFVF